ncbi:hypothetical protein [Pseudoprimorskyibacter insulae]|uniref:Lipocalin-like domain-containing protein n=1 Tax=Pseudoprimorskyibacter insulae TaxID=1695997 RepID=A0A2R8AYG7_9RHOB|nr:hypothetical protein [Pseudoprimorskyibacter insulae]SPF81072.1 hypothetical protein PRI8871_02889 [Pseudoprimorskyibacter insulae]
MSNCIGTWVLIPELCHYSKGHPPDAGRYEIGMIDGRFVFVIQSEKDGQPVRSDFSAPANGEAEETHIPGLTHVSVQAVDDATLDSSAFAGDRRMAYARRRVSPDGQLLSVFMENNLPSGAVQIYQVYKRA